MNLPFYALLLCSGFLASFSFGQKTSRCSIIEKSSFEYDQNGLLKNEKYADIRSLHYREIFYQYDSTLNYCLKTTYLLNHGLDLKREYLKDSLGVEWENIQFWWEDTIIDKHLKSILPDTINYSRFSIQNENSRLRYLKRMGKMIVDTINLNKVELRTNEINQIMTDTTNSNVKISFHSDGSISEVKNYECYTFYQEGPKDYALPTLKKGQRILNRKPKNLQEWRLDTTLTFLCYVNQNLDTNNCILGSNRQFNQDSILENLSDKRPLYLSSIDRLFHDDYYQTQFDSVPWGHTEIWLDSLSTKCYGHICDILIHFKQKDKIPKGPGIISSQPLPKQTWSMLELTKKDSTTLLSHSQTWERVSLINTSKGKFLVGHYDISILGEKNAHDEYNTMIFKYSKHKKQWILVEEFESQGNWPFFDLDGDGIPELYGSTGYKSIIVRKMYPKVERLLYQNSGI